MATLSVGAMAPEFSLESVDGESFSLNKALKLGPVVAAFFKITCPVCQLGMPYAERLYRAYRGSNVTVLGISQNDAQSTRMFMKEYGLTLPVLLDTTRSYPVSNAFGLTNVPTFFYISREGGIEYSIVGWDRAEFEAMNRRLAADAGASPAEVFSPGEDVPEFKAG